MALQQTILQRKRDTDSDLVIPTEKEALKTKHLNYIEEFNHHLPDDQKLVFNQQEFEAKLDDPKVVDQIRKGAARMERLNKQEQIHAEMISKHGNPPAGRDYLNRVFQYSYKTEDTPEAKEYNERIHSEYVNNPEKVVYQRIQRLLNFDPKQFIEALGDDKKLIDFYDENQELVEDAFAFDSICGNARNILSPQLNNAVRCIKKPLEALNECQKLAFAAAGNGDYVTLPKLTGMQASLIMAGNPTLVTMDKENFVVRNYLLNSVAALDEGGSTAEFYNKMLAKDWKVDKDFFVSHVAEERDPQTGAVSEVSLDAYFNNRPNVTLRSRTKEEMWHIRNIRKDYEREYANIWRDKYAQLNHQPLDIQALETRTKGGFFERLFRTTSKEYRNFLKTLKDFNDPNSKDFMNREKMRKATDAYKTHKLAGGRTVDQLDSTGKGRMAEIDKVVSTLDYMEQNDSLIRRNIEANVYGIPHPPVGEQFLKKNDVEPKNEINNEISKENKIEEPQKNIEEPNNVLSNN